MIQLVLKGLGGAYCVAEAPLCSCMVDMVLLIEDRRRAGKFLMKVRFINFSVVNNGNHFRVIEAQMVRPTSHNRAFRKMRQLGDSVM